MIKDHLIRAAGAVVAIAVTAGIVETAGTVATEEIAAIAMAAAEASTPARAPAAFVMTSHKKSITKTMICCAAMCTKMAKSALVGKRVTAPNTSANWLWQSSVPVTWRCCLSPVKFYANFTR